MCQSEEAATQASNHGVDQPWLILHVSKLTGLGDIEQTIIRENTPTNFQELRGLVDQYGARGNTVMLLQASMITKWSNDPGGVFNEAPRKKREQS